MRVLVTGCAGFIGAHLCMKLLKKNIEVIGIDNLNAYYDASLKEARLNLFKSDPRFRFYKVDIANKTALSHVFEDNDITHVVNLAAQPGVRYSLQHPDVYLQSNIVGFFNVLELSRHYGILHVVFSSSSSVYGANTAQPYSEHDHTDHPIALYAATKKANEVMAHSYAASHGLPCTGLRFFTVYGPWGRPDMALFTFTRQMLAKESIEVYNNGEMARDFTYVDDVVESVARIVDKPAMPDDAWHSDAPDAASSYAPYRLYNVGRGEPVTLMDFIHALEKALGIQAIKKFLPLQQGDVVKTAADISLLSQAISFKPSVTLQEGVEKFVMWYRSYYG